MIYTSYYASPALRSLPKSRQVAISVGTPKGWTGRKEGKLAPTWAMVRMSMDEDYKSAYAAILARLNPKEIAAGMDGCVLLCWERDPKECHRSLVADWLRAAGAEVAEL